MPRTAKTTDYHDPRLLVERHIVGDIITGDIALGHASRAASRSVTVSVSESPLAWLHARGHLTDRQLLAGEKLRYDYEAASLGPQVTMRWDVVPMTRTRRAGPTAVTPTERMISAKDRFDHAITAMGRDLADIAWRVICAGEGVPAAERAMGWPTRSGKLVLKIALDRLAEYYRLPG